MNMNEAKMNQLSDAVKEAERFINKARVAWKRLHNDEHLCGTKETAAAKRASMDLTRALVSVRK